MYMKDMNAYFERRGYECRRDYIRDTQNYVFTISKDGHHTKMTFDYRPAESTIDRDKRQKRFLEDLIEEHEKNLKYYAPLTASPGFNMDGLYVECSIDKPKFPMGTKVVVITGPYMGMDGCIIQYANDKYLYKIENSLGTWWVKENEIEIELRDKGEKIMNYEKKFDIGALVKIVRGPYMGSIGSIESVCPSVMRPGNYRYYIDISMSIPYAIGRKTISCFGEDIILVEDTSKQFVKNTYNTMFSCDIEDVIFNAPATIVFWKDGTKTVVKATNEEFDPEKGLAMAIVKKLYGNKGNYFNKLKKWLPDEE